MVGPSKILTVSYGTFSCTLEGFDDPFSTMRGIAEYFRDLAADDRYFGAEPPTPDAEMLHRIAEKEINRRVEARVEDGGIVLRQLHDDVKAPLRKPKPNAIATGAAAGAVSESVAARLARIRASVARRENTELGFMGEDRIAADYSTSPITAAFDDVPDAETTVEEPAIAQTQTSFVAPASEFVEETEAEETPADAIDLEHLTEAPTDTVLETAADDAVEPEAEIEVEVEAEVEAEADEEVEAAAEVVAEDEAEFEPEVEAEVEFEAPVEVTAEPVQDDDEFETLAENDTAPGLNELFEDESETDDLDEPAAMAGLTDDISETDEQIEDEDEDEDEDDAQSGDPLDESAIARVVKLRRSEPAQGEAETETTDMDIHDAFKDVETAAADGETSEDDEQDDDSDDWSSDWTEDQDGDQEAEVAEAAELSDEDEADLKAALDLVQREAEADARADKESRAILAHENIEENGKAVDRILEVTNHELEETEGTRRRSAIAHLKAAVAATRADKLLSRKSRDAEEVSPQTQYREDLAQVVKPRRPITEGVKSVARRLAPLVLVSEQRVDSVAPATDGNNVVRPRRVQTEVQEASHTTEESADTGDSLFSDAASFAEFAAQMGAAELPDLLEAAAAYALFVEGRPHFSRPQLMQSVKVLRAENHEEFSREESLRSFGQLLRRGKIRKLQRGQFTVPQSSRFNPEARAAGE